MTDWRDRIVEVKRMRVRDILAHERNPRLHPAGQKDAVRGLLNEVGKADVLRAYTGADGKIKLWDGHLRQGLDPDQEWWVAITDLTEAEAAKMLVLFDPIAALAEQDTEKLEALLRDVNTGDAALQQMLADMAEDAGIVPPNTEAGKDTEPEINKADELRQKWQVEPGQMWQLGEHRLICGDCTDKATVERVMGGDRAVLCHADPPYGMGKEKDGIANDNLYRDKLDTFQMQWWRACRPRLEDNASAYIWGNAEDLWRLWYIGGLKNSERLTLRNEIVWDKGYGQGMESDAHRMYPTATERCLFFMLGEQGFNNNADNYWEGWDAIVDYLEKSRQAMGWSIKDTKRIAGHSEKSGCHWFDKSQWSMPTEDTYKAWQKAARGDAFKREYDDIKREYDDIKREFYATRAHFDNVHDGMTDVWKFERVQGDDRHEHATPKPLSMMERAIKSSAPAGTLVYVPFNGSGPEIIACENLGRRARAVEISPGYVAMALERWSAHANKTPVLVD